jgi:hypothetical protein
MPSLDIPCLAKRENMNIMNMKRDQESQDRTVQYAAELHVTMQDFAGPRNEYE